MHQRIANKRLEPTRSAPPVYSYASGRAAQARRSANRTILPAEGSEISDLAVWSVRAGNMPALRSCWMQGKA